VSSANDRKQALLKVVKSATTAMDPEVATKSAIRVTDDTLHLGRSALKLGELGKVRVLAVGKAAVPMARGAIAALSTIIEDTLAITAHASGKQSFRVLTAGHPIPDSDSEKAAKAALHFVTGLGPHDRILLLLSSGAGSLMSLPVDGVDMKSEQKMFELLLRSGAPTSDLHIIRKHLSTIKGGFFLNAIAPASIITLALSDLPSDNVDTVSGGLANFDPSTFANALQIIEKYDLVAETPKPVMTYLRAGVEGKVPETPKPLLGKGAPPFWIIRSPRDLVNAAARACEAIGMATQMPFPLADNPIEEVARRYGSWVVQSRAKLLQRPLVLIGGGEPRVKVTGKGTGGRNQHLALLMARHLEGDKGAIFLGVASDGVDGHDKASGAFVTDATAAKAKDKKLNIDKALEKFDSFSIHDELGTALPGKPTETPVGDLHLICLEPG
jgi:glycerate 2-kinase